MPVIRVERAVDAPREAAWDALAEPAAIAEHAPNLSRAVTEGEGVGMHRRCWDTEDRGWDETCVVWEPGERYRFEVDVETSESPAHRPFDGFAGTFGVDDRPGGATVWVEFDLEPRFGPLGVVVGWLARPVIRRVAGAMLDAWAAAIEAEAAPVAADGGGSGKEEP